MTAAVATFVSYRLGGVDGVSVEASKWETTVADLGFTTRRVAGELDDGLRPDDTWLPFLAIHPVAGAAVEPHALAAALAGSDLVVVENLCSLPLNPLAATTAAEVLSEHQGRVLFHHHDLPWERPALPRVAGIPPDRPGSLHVTINDLARHALAARGIAAHTVRNAFDLHAPLGDRDRTRADFGFRPDDVVVLQPTRAIPRKEVGRAIRFAEELDGLLTPVRYWLTGPAEDGFDAELDRLIDAARVPVTRGRARRREDAYAAADVVVFPSSREGFGNPLIEATIAHRPVVTTRYPVLDELAALGLRTFSVDDPAGVAAWLLDPDPAIHEQSLAFVRAQLDLDDLPARITEAFATVGWTQW